ncbi:MAG TPA: hypothetical protein VMI94_06425 [Bryobacteraceae bacterium]|nr:hypothetical protein [Bryobacteraceae bacterium]
MPRVRLIHWKAAEAAPLIAALRGAGYEVDYDEQLQGDAFRRIRQSPPDVFVIDLSRLPSHGREVAVFLRGHQTTRGVPMVFVGGEPEKVRRIRELLPDAVYASAATVRSAVRHACASRPAAPVVPPQMMQRYTGRTTAQKLGIREGARIAVIDPPRNYAAAIGELPAGAVFEETPASPGEVTLWFVQGAAGCAASLPAMRALAARTKLWILWRKGSEVSQQFLRKSATAVGLVDYKICAVGPSWSGMLFARKKAV